MIEIWLSEFCHTLIYEQTEYFAPLIFPLFSLVRQFFERAIACKKTNGKHRVSMQLVLLPDQGIRKCQIYLTPSGIWLYFFLELEQKKISTRMIKSNDWLAIATTADTATTATASRQGGEYNVVYSWIIYWTRIDILVTVVMTPLGVQNLEQCKKF